MIRSPFFVIEEAISPSKCELITSTLGISVPSRDEKNRPIKHERLVKDPELLGFIKDAVQDHVPAIESRFDCVVKSLDAPLFRQYFESPDVAAEPHACENSSYLRKKWVKTKDVDLVGYLWLKDFNSGVPLDPRFETYGGKLEFPAYDFSLVPQRGTMVIFPGSPHFITAISPVLVGSLEIIKVGLKLRTEDGSPWVYQPARFPGTYQEWFTAIDQ